VKFIHFLPNLGIATSQPVYDEEGNLLGVLATELALSQLGDSRANVQIGKSGQSFIIEHSGEMAASSIKEPPFIVSPDRVACAQSRSVRAIARVRNDCKLLKAGYH